MILGVSPLLSSFQIIRRYISQSTPSLTFDITRIWMDRRVRSEPALT